MRRDWYITVFSPHGVNKKIRKIRRPSKTFERALSYPCVRFLAPHREQVWSLVLASTVSFETDFQGAKEDYPSIVSVSSTHTYTQCCSRWHARMKISTH